MSDTPTDSTSEPTDNTDNHAATSDDPTIGRLRRRNFLKGLATTGALSGAGAEALTGSASATASTAETGWQPQPPQLETPWTSEVGPDNAHPEYPRPQMVREHWKNLNGVWQFAGASEGESPPIGQELDERILVPYPVESGLSGIKRHETWMWYRRQFSVPDEWVVPTATEDDDDNNPNAQRLLLNFERVDWEATVYVNGQEVASHQGGYDHFTADVTDALVEGGPQELVVGVYDPTGDNTKPIGTQPKGRQGVGSGFEGDDHLWMTPTSGIWDTVWLEPVPDGYVADLDLTPDLDRDVLRITVDSTTDDATVVATAYDGDEKVGRVIGRPNQELELAIDDPHYWTPEDPFLYDLDVQLRRKDGPGRVTRAGGGKLLDRVESYFGMRSLGKVTVEKTARPTINGEMVYQLGSLESGQWPDGLYTAPTDEALRWNIQAQRDLGFNMVRKHGKVETRRWFYHADQLGLLVWQDMPWMEENFDTAPRSEEAKEHFKKEFRAIIAELSNHPSMAVWTAFNEGWGINNDSLDFIAEVVEMVQELDPERLVNANTGYDVGSNQDPLVGDFKDRHQYGIPRVEAPEPEPDRISALGEYTSPSAVIPDHHWGDCGGNTDVEFFVDEYLDTVETLQSFMVGKSLSSSTYTATTSLENVCNGHITYDRKVIKAELAKNGLERIQSAHEAIIEKSRRVMGNLAIDVETPPAYRAGGLLGTAEPFEVSVTVRNPESTPEVARALEDVTVDISGDLPDGWTVSQSGATSFDVIDDGESATATWSVTPDATADGDVSFDVTVDYTIDGRSYQYDETRTIGAAQLAYWRFENTTEDESSYGNELTLQNGASFTDETAVEGDYSLHLDGSNQHALISAFGAGMLHDAFSERSVSMWIKPDTVTGDQVLYNEGGYLNGMGLRITNGSLEAAVARNGDLGTTSALFTSTGWTHVAAVFDHGTLSLYVDSEEVASTDVGYDTVPSHVAGSELGGNATTTPWVYDDSASPFFGGTIDATAIYDVALTRAEIEEIGTRSFSIDAPTFYTTSDDPQPFSVDATFSDLRADDGVTFENLTMSVAELPDGWSASAETTTSFGTVPGGDSVTATWNVTPAPGTTGQVEVEVAADFEVDGEQRRIVDGTTLETLGTAALAEWPLDGTTEDASGNGHDATLVNGASFDDQVVARGSHSVDVTGSNDWVDLAEGGEDFLSQPFSKRTVALWVKPTSTSGSQVLYNQGAAFQGMNVRINDGTIQVGTVSSGSLATAQAPFSSTDWTHVAAVFDAGTLRLYVDGEQVAVNEDTGYNSVGGGYWGGELGHAERSFWKGNFDGHVDHAAIYPFALSADLIAGLASTN